MSEQEVKCLEWTSDQEREVAGYGLMHKGIRKCWPAPVVDSLVEQGLAKEIPSLRYRESPKKGKAAEEE